MCCLPVRGVPEKHGFLYSAQCKRRKANGAMQTAQRRNANSAMQMAERRNANGAMQMAQRNAMTKRNPAKRVQNKRA